MIQKKTNCIIKFIKSGRKNILSKKDEMEEFIFMGLRMNEGINLDEFYEKFNVNFKHKYNNIKFIWKFRKNKW